MGVRKSSLERPRALKTKVVTGGYGGQPMQTNRLRNEATINVGATTKAKAPPTTISSSSPSSMVPINSPGAPKTDIPLEIGNYDKEKMAYLDKVESNVIDKITIKAELEAIVGKKHMEIVKQNSITSLEETTVSIEDNEIKSPEEIENSKSEIENSKAEIKNSPPEIENPATKNENSTPEIESSSLEVEKVSPPVPATRSNTDHQNQVKIAAMQI